MKDSEFIRLEKVPMTKREVRAVIFDRLELHRASRFIDIGAGTGSIAVEAALKNTKLKVIAIEKNPTAVVAINQNLTKFDCTNVHVLENVAPCEINGKADAIFVGGSGGNLIDIIDWALLHLVPNGRLVLSFILNENFIEAVEYLKTCKINDFDALQLNLSHMTPLGAGHFFKPNNPTYVVSCLKG